MHPLVGLSSLLLVVFAGCLALQGLRYINNWSWRRDLQLLILALPVISLGLSLGALYHFAGRICFLNAPPWDYTLGLTLPISMGLVALGGLGLGLLRLALIRRLVAQSAIPAGPELQALTERLAVPLDVWPPRLLLCAYDRPLALTLGFRGPTLLLSTWMLTHLDRGELEAVLVHELGHIARRDSLVVWLATMLRDAFFYLPTSWAVYRRLQWEKELACDDLAVGATKRPLALASALAKVWQHALAVPLTGPAQPFVGADASLESRIKRLLTTKRRRDSLEKRPHAGIIAVSGAVTAVLGLVALQVANVAVLLVPMGCGPASGLGKLL